MKIYKRDHKLNAAEKKQIVERINARTFLKYNKEKYQCGQCHKIFDNNKETCPKCGNTANEYITTRKFSYENKYSVQVFRQEKDYVIELLFVMDDYQRGKEKGFERVFHLIRKTEYKDKVRVMVSAAASYNSQLHVFTYWSSSWRTHDEKFYKEKYSLVKSFTTSWRNITINKKILLFHEKLKYIYNLENLREIDNRHIGLALQYPHIVEMLEKHSKRSDKYYSLNTLKRYKKTYLKYFEWFEEEGHIKPKLIMKLSKLKETITHQDFKRLMKFKLIPAEINTRRELELYAQLAPKDNRQFDEQNYKDYLRMAADRNLDLKSEEILFNRNWRNQHDEWALEAKYEKEKHKDPKFKKAYKGLQTTKIKDYIVKVPDTIKDLFVESETLHHCVRAYVDRIIKGETLILFLRNKIDEPFITVEVKDHHITQIRGTRNKTSMIRPIHREVVNKYIKDCHI